MRFSAVRLAGLVSAISLMAAGCGTSPVSGLGKAVLSASGSGTLYLRNGQAQILVKRRAGAVLTANLSGMGLRPASIGRGLSGLGWQMVSLPAGRVSEAVAALRGDPSVLAVQPNYQRKAIVPKGFTPDVPGTLETIFPGLGTVPAAIPNDPLYKKQYAPQLVHAPEAWASSTGKGVVTAIVDTGVDIDHPDLKAHVIGGWNTVDNTANAKDDHGHGTHVAGITAALANNKEGVVGIAPDATIMPIKVLGGDGSGSDETVASGITWAADHGAKVINMSLGGPGESQVLAEACAYALRKGVAVVAAMGNDGTNEKSYPAAYPGVIAVGATDKGDRVASFSQWGDWISVSAPGVKILSTFPTYKVTMSDYGFPMTYASLDGTSMATPAVAGAVAVMRAKLTALDPAQIKARLQATTDKVSGQQDYDLYYGYGRVNAAKAIK